MCLVPGRPTVDTHPMGTAERIFRMRCVTCDRPAVTFDELRDPLCSRHATVVVMAERIVPEDDRWWEDLAVEASG